MNFLIVDDNRLLNRFMVTYLRGKGHTASALSDFSKASSWLEMNPCDSILIATADRHKPSDKGIELCKTIREKHVNLPIAMFTPGYEEETLQAARKAGADGFVSKGLGPSEIYSSLMRVMNTKQSAAAD